jgi:3,4-dihydroxy 2-butanone 4-phosphate synthase/GTP cyclohydrolase II
MLDRAGSGVLVYLRQEGKGAGIAREIKACAAQPSGPAPADASASGTDPRTYGIGAQILRALGVRRVRLLTNHPRKWTGLQAYDIVVTEQIPLESGAERRPEDLLRTGDDGLCPTVKPA